MCNTNVMLSKFKFFNLSSAEYSLHIYIYIAEMSMDNESKFYSNISNRAVFFIYTSNIILFHFII